MNDDGVTTSVQVSLNGQAVHTQAETLHALLLDQGFNLGGAMACALNQQFVPRARWAQQALASGDRIDVVAPITGG